MSATNYSENAFLDAFLGTAHTVDFAATVYIGLFTATPNETGGGTEVSGGSYARVAVTNNDANWPDAVSGSKTNATIVTFPGATLGWGVITHWGIFSASTAGTLYLYGELSVPRDVISGDVMFFPASGLTITCD